MQASEFDIGDIFFDKEESLIGFLIKKEYIDRTKFNYKTDHEIEVWMYTLSFTRTKKNLSPQATVKPKFEETISQNVLCERVWNHGWKVQRRKECKQPMESEI